MRAPNNESAGEALKSSPARGGGPRSGGGVGLRSEALSSNLDGTAEPPHRASGGLPPRTGEDRDEHVPERTCVLTRRAAPQHTLVRLALGPDGTVHPDVLARAGGRGAWIGVTREELERAQTKGKLGGALIRAFRTGEFVLPEDLPTRIEAALERTTLDRLGMEARASTLLTGSARIEEAARAGAVTLLLHASDARDDGRRKLDQAWRVGEGKEGSGRQGTVLPVDRDRLSVALGRSNAVHVAAIEAGAAARVGRLLDRWRHYLGSTNDTAGATTRPAQDETERA